MKIVNYSSWQGDLKNDVVLEYISASKVTWFYQLENTESRLDMVMNACNQDTWALEARRQLQVQGQPSRVVSPKATLDQKQTINQRTQG